ncbi:MAG: response regulator [Candidatus Eremiobacteraeota bacterium]|nr:response regulator [Candidatus Eremiobacteraeota bacterium]MCW5871228.1 response regulator [Candidatus Eremiobacteraeota bacterium]
MPVILVLEDDDELREVLVDVLEDNQHQVRGVPRGEQAIQLFQEYQFDLLVVDIRMAGPDGLQTLSYLRQLGFSVPTLVMTGFADQSDPVRALRLGAKEYLMKPFALDEFLWAVDRILEERRQSEAQRQQTTEVVEAVEWVLSRLGGLSLVACREFSQRLDLTPMDRLLLLVSVALREKLKGQPAPPELPPSLAQILRDWEAPWDAQEALVSRAGSLLENLEQPLSEGALGKLKPGQFDPYLLETLSTSLKAETGNSSQLLDLINILLACGDRTSSRKAFEQLLASVAAPSPERVFALLGLCDGLAPAALDGLMLSLLAELQQLPVGEAVAALWRGGHWLVRLQRPEIAPLLKSLGSQALKASRRTAVAQASLLAWAVDGSLAGSVRGALQQLMLPENLSHLRPALDWLLPPLLNALAADEGLQPLLSRLCRQESQTVAYALRHQRLSLEGRLFVAEALEGLGASAEEALVLLAEDASPKVRELAGKSRAGKPALETIPIQVVTFGGFELWVGPHKIAESSWRGSRVKHLAAYVAISVKPVPGERLLELFWPESLEKGQRGLQSALTVIRGACRDFEEVKGLSILVRESECVLFPDRFTRWVDCHEFDRLVRQAGQCSQLEQRSALLQRAVALYKGPCLDGCFLEWALTMQSEYEQMALQAMLQLGSAELAQQRWLSALQTAKQALRIDPLLTQAAAVTVRAHIGSGNTELALQFFDGFQRRYQEEFGQSLHLDEMLKDPS